MGIIKEQEQAIINLMQSVTDGKTIELAHTKALEFATLMSYYKCAMIEIEAKLNVLNVEYSLSFDRNPINSIKTRLRKSAQHQGKAGAQRFAYFHRIN